MKISKPRSLKLKNTKNKLNQCLIYYFYGYPFGNHNKFAQKYAKEKQIDYYNLSEYILHFSLFCLQENLTPENIFILPSLFKRSKIDFVNGVMFINKKNYKDINTNRFSIEIELRYLINLEFVQQVETFILKKILINAKKKKSIIIAGNKMEFKSIPNNYIFLFIAYITTENNQVNNLIQKYGNSSLKFYKKDALVIVERLNDFFLHKYNAIPKHLHIAYDETLIPLKSTKNFFFFIDLFKLN